MDRRFTAEPLTPRQWRLPAQTGAAAAAHAPVSHSTTLNRATLSKHGAWSLLINALVEIRHDGQVIRTGVVEDAMPDSSVLWIAADADGPRQMFEASQGHQVWVTPQELPDGLRYRMTKNQIFRGASTRNA
ncbi:MAG: hypothetical protein ACQEXN_12415 [Actinomycetota bacterium]